jgi:hypothetical protein
MLGRNVQIGGGRRRVYTLWSRKILDVVGGIFIVGLHVVWGRQVLLVCRSSLS